MQFKRIMSFVVMGIFLAACDSTVTNINDDAKDKGTIILHIVDGHSGIALSDVSVLSIERNKTALSDEMGLYVWNDGTIGSHAFEISKEGYATLLAQVELREQGEGDVVRVGDTTATIQMFRTGVSAKGSVVYRDDNGNLKPVEKATVYANLPSVFYPSEITDTTDKNGEFVFENLPEDIVINIHVGQQTIDSKIYTDSIANRFIGDVKLRAGDEVNVELITLYKNSANLIKISDNLKDIDSSSSLEFSFSAELLADSVTKSIWTVTNASGTTVLSTPSLSKNKKTISIAPFSKTWNDGYSYTVSGTAYSTDGASLAVTGKFMVGGKTTSSAVPGNVSDLKITTDEDNPDYAVLSWMAPKGDVYRYNIYYMTNVDVDYTLLTYVSSSNTKYSVDITDFESEVKTISFVVLPVNDALVEADVSKAKSVKYEL